MWKHYARDFIKNNRSSGFSVRLSAFISALLLSLLCGLFYNDWKYEVERIEIEEGGWHSRITGEFDRDTLESIKNFATVKEAVINQKESTDTETVVDLYFDRINTVIPDTPRIALLAGVSPDKITYNYPLLAMYLVRHQEDTAPRLLFPLFILITGLASFSLIIIIHNAFALSMNARIHQFGIFSSIGATPRQIRTCLLQEAAALCALPILTGNLLGIGGSMGAMHLSNVLLGSHIPGRHQAVPGYHPLVLLLTLLITVATIWISAWLPAWKLSRLTPLEAIQNTGELQLKRRKNSPILALLWGAEGELAGNALKAQRKALRTASLSLVLSFLAFTIMQCFFTLSGISTRETYFEKYQDSWDILVTLKDTDVDAFQETGTVQGLPGVEDAVVYQRASAKTIVEEARISEALEALGGFSHASGKFVTKTEKGWLVNAPLIIMDDTSFLNYCQQIGASPRLDGAVVINQIRDVTNPDFRHPVFMPYIREENAISVLRPAGKEEAEVEIPVLSYTDQVPTLREEYATLDYYELVHFIPVSLWREIKGELDGAKEDTCIRLLGKEGVTLEELNALQSQITRLLGQTYALESENRILEYEINDKQIQGLKAILGGFCVLLAIIGTGNVFSNTLGFVYQRKREFARYMSVGLTPGQIRKMFCIEALVIGLRPLLITLPLAVLAVGYMLKLSYLAAGEFLAEAPLLPILLLFLAVWGFVALAYAISWRTMRGIHLAEVLRNDTMM